ncbi:cytidine deaminase [Namhaeicola litoreus]|uniref:Cytidine deaminase n=1 Tax=Namhaeicola litoreus TaxID=1052145 RepID=A0ABW3Y759_9FLAO
MKDLEHQIKFIEIEDRLSLNEQEKELLSIAESARDKAYAPYSKFLVGASVLLENGKIITGNNQENAAYPSGMCAERVAVWKAMSEFPELEIKSVFIVAKSLNHKITEPIPPCGGCRQTLLEYEFRQKKPITIYFSGESGKIIKVESINQLLPFAFNPNYL